MLYDRVARQYIPASTPTLGLSGTSPPPWDYLELPPYRRAPQTPETSAHSLSFSCNPCGNLSQHIARLKNHIKNSHSPGIREIPPQLGQLLCLDTPRFSFALELILFSFCFSCDVYESRKMLTRPK